MSTPTRPKRGAAKAAPTSASPAYKPEATYKVQLSRPVEIPGGHLVPIHDHRIKGSFLATLPADAVAEAVELAPRRFDQAEG